MKVIKYFAYHFVNQEKSKKDQSLLHKIKELFSNADLIIFHMFLLF